MTRKQRHKHQDRLERIRRAGERKRLRDELRAERRRFFPPRKRPSTSKLALAYIFLSCTVVQVYSMAAMWRLCALSPLATLIGATVGEAISYCAYVAKSTKENTAGGIIYDTAMLDRAEVAPPEAPDENTETPCG